MSKKTETLQDYLDGKVTEENGNIENAVNTKTEKKDKKKNKLIALIALLLAGVTAIGCAIGFKNKNKTNEQTTTTTIVSFDDLGMEEEFPTNSQYGNTTGNIKKEDIVEKDGVYYDSQESADKSDKVGQTKIDTQNGTLTVNPDGTVSSNDIGYEVLDGNGGKQDTGSNSTGIPAGFIKLDKDYYYKNGSLVFKKGTLVDEEEFNSLKHLLITDPKQATVTTTESTTRSETTTGTFIPTQGTINADGTYTVDGFTFESKSDYEQWILQGYEGYGIDSKDGIMKPIEKISSNSKSK